MGGVQDRVVDLQHDGLAVEAALVIEDFPDQVNLFPVLDLVHAHFSRNSKNRQEGVNILNPVVRTCSHGFSPRLGADDSTLFDTRTRAEARDYMLEP